MARSPLRLFIHWGLYALAARHEWVKNHERIPDHAYGKDFDHFDPDLLDLPVGKPAFAVPVIELFLK